MSVPLCRWGILGTATIGRKNWQAIRNSGNGAVMAVASRDRDRAQQFIDDCQARFPVSHQPIALGDYDELVSNPNIEAVYIPLPTGLRKEWVIKAAERGKHVLCEKPCAVSSKDLELMLDACETNGVQFMDGVMYMHSARLQAMRAQIDDPSKLGELRRIATQFSFCAPPEFFENNIRIDNRLEPYGCLGDLGWYTLRLILWTMHYDLPQRLTARMLRRTPTGDVPLEFSAELFFEGGVTATMYNSFVTGHQQWAHLSGSKGFLQVNDFVLPYFANRSEFTVNRCDFNPTGWDFNMERYSETHEVAEYSNGTANAPEANLFRHFGDLVVSNRWEGEWHDYARKTQLLLDACYQSAKQDGAMIEIPQAKQLAV